MKQLFILFISFFCFLFVNCSNIKNETIKLDSSCEKYLLKLNDSLSNKKFLGRFYVLDSINEVKYSYIKDSFKIPYHWVDSLSSYNVISVLKEKRYTYYLLNGYFLNGNIGYLYTQHDIESIHGIAKYKHIKSYDNKGSWFYVEFKY